MDNQSILETEKGQPYEIPENGSLGLLALGYVGVMLWREKRQQVQQEKLDQAQTKNQN
jgi:hypothetical protein